MMEKAVNHRASGCNSDVRVMFETLTARQASVNSTWELACDSSMGIAPEDSGSQRSRRGAKALCPITVQGGQVDTAWA